MQAQLLEVKERFAVQNLVDISEVPLYKVKTPLQRAIQLMKRHRDVMYKDAPECQKGDAPISIIITTLAAHAYNNESSVITALDNILNNMQRFVEVRNNSYWIGNPVMPEENFAEKWNEEPNKQSEFMRWLEQAKQDMLVEPLKVHGLHNVSESMQRSFGSGIVRKSFSDVGNQTRADRDAGALYVSGLTGGLTTSSEGGTKKVGGHTFFGK